MVGGGLSGCTNFTDLNNLRSVGRISISSGALNNLESVTEYIAISAPSVHLPNLKSVGGDLSIRGSFNTLDGLNNLQTIGGNLSISESNTLSGLNNLRTIGGNLSISGNFSTLDGLNSLQTIEIALSISSKQLTNLNALTNLQTVKDISITSCPQLYDFCVLKPIVEKLTGSFYTNNNGYSPTKYQILNGKCSKQPE